MMPKNPSTIARRIAVPGTFALLVGLGLWVFPACSAEKGSAAGGSTAVAKIKDRTITEAEVMAGAADAFEQVEIARLQCEASYHQSRHQVLEGQVQALIEKEILGQEAAARGMTAEELLMAEVESKVAAVSDADVDAFYEENKARIPRPKDQVAEQIRRYLEQQRQQELRQTFLASLEAKYGVVRMLEPLRLEVESAGHPAVGAPDAPITIVEFSDFECPFCSRLNPTLDEIKANYAGKVRLVFRQFPLAMHQNAQKAAEASLCAHDQGQFWPMHDKLFADQRGLAVEQLKAKAAELGLDSAQFAQCLDSGQHAERVRADLRAGASAGVSGTPAMFVNGRFISGAVPYEEIATVIDDELRRKGIASN